MHLLQILGGKRSGGLCRLFRGPPWEAANTLFQALLPLGMIFKHPHILVARPHLTTPGCTASRENKVRLGKAAAEAEARGGATAQLFLYFGFLCFLLLQMHQPQSWSCSSLTRWIQCVIPQPRVCQSCLMLFLLIRLWKINAVMMHTCYSVNSLFSRKQVLFRG